MKVAICIPRHGDTRGDFTISLARMIAFSLSRPGPGGAPLEIEIFSVGSSDLPASRTRLLQQAIAWQARYLLWLDSDHVFPPDTLFRLPVVPVTRDSEKAIDSALEFAGLLQAA